MHRVERTLPAIDLHRRRPGVPIADGFGEAFAPSRPFGLGLVRVQRRSPIRDHVVTFLGGQFPRLVPTFGKNAAQAECCTADDTLPSRTGSGHGVAAITATPSNS